MNRFSVKCPSCHFPLPAELYNSAKEHHVCRSCDTKVKIHALPALYLPVGSPTETREVELGTASCFFHETKQAEHVCDACGRFLCELCSLPMGNEVLCTSCLERKREEPEGSEHLIPRQVRHDKLALILSAFPLFVFIFTSLPLFLLFRSYIRLELFYGSLGSAFISSVFTAPTSLIVAIRYWRPRGIFTRGWRGRIIISMLLALVEVGFIGMAIFGIFINLT